MVSGNASDPGRVSDARLPQAVQGVLVQRPPAWPAFPAVLPAATETFPAPAPALWPRAVRLTRWRSRALCAQEVLAGGPALGGPIPKLTPRSGCGLRIFSGPKRGPRLLPPASISASASLELLLNSEKGEVLLRGFGTLLYFSLPIASVQWQPDGLTIHTKKWFLGARSLGAPPISLMNSALAGPSQREVWGHGRAVVGAPCSE